MTPQQLVGLGIRLVAILVALIGISYWGDVASALIDNGQSSQSAYLVGVVFALIAALLWFFPMAIAHWIIPRTQFENHLKVQGLDFARVGCSLIGLFSLVIYFRQFTWQVFRIWINLQFSDGSTSFWNTVDFADKANLFSLIVVLALAITLIVRSADFARFIFRDKRNSLSNNE